MAARVTLTCKRHPPLLIPANPYPMYPYVEVLNYLAIDSATGRRHVFFDNIKEDGDTVEKVSACISFKCLSYDFAKDYERFLLSYAKLGQMSMEISCPPYIDFGMGKGQLIKDAWYSGPPDLKEIITPHDDAGLLYDIELPYMFIRSAG